MRVPRVKDFHESKEYDRILAECLRPLGDRIQGFRVDVQNAFHWTAVPATVIAINSHFDVNMRISSRLAVVFSLLYLADYMHYSVKDTDQYSDDYESAQFAILMGDYLFGRAVELLSDVNGHVILPHFSELISQINEGHTMIKAGSYANDLGVIAREKASFYRFAFLTAAVMADCPQTECSVYEEMGQNLGMAVALSANGLVAESQTYLHELENLWRLVPKRHGGASLALRSFLTEIAKGIVPSWEVVAI